MKCATKTGLALQGRSCVLGGRASVDRTCSDKLEYGEFEGSMPRALYHVPWAISGQLIQCGMAHCPIKGRLG